MGLFDMFGKGKSKYDASNIKVTDLDHGFIFDYDMKTWVVEEVYKYDWGDKCFSYEYKIVSSDQTLFLSVEDDDDLEIALFSKISIRKLQEDLPEIIEKNKKPPTSIEHNNFKFLLEEESPGYFCNQTKDKNNWIELLSWDYEEEDGNNLISIEQWGDREFDASVGFKIKPFEISNILPGK